MAGIGKTTVFALLGLPRRVPGERVIANPDAGTPAERLPGRQPIYTVRNLAAPGARPTLPPGSPRPPPTATARHRPRRAAGRRLGHERR